MYSILLKTSINRGDRDRKFDLCIKGCLASNNNNNKKGSYIEKSEINKLCRKLNDLAFASESF